MSLFENEFTCAGENVVTVLAPLVRLILPALKAHTTAGISEEEQTFRVVDVELIETRMLERNTAAASLFVSISKGENCDCLFFIERLGSIRTWHIVESHSAISFILVLLIILFIASLCTNLQAYVIGT